VADHALVAAARKARAEVKAFTTPKKGELPRWIGTRARGTGVEFERGAADLLADLIGPNILALNSEIEKLATYAGAKERVTVSMVETLVGAVTQDSVFVLVDAIATGDRARVFELMRRQQETAATPMEFALSLIRLLARQMRILLRIHLGQESGRSMKEITAAAKIPPYYADRYLRQARRLPRAQILRSFEQLAELEHALKTGKAEPESGLDLLVTEMCR
jgi:DNA polymerase III subunit delta